jgi:cell division protein FtsB
MLRWAITLLAVGVLKWALVVVWFVVDATLSKIESLNAEIDELEAEYERLKTKERR